MGIANIINNSTTTSGGEIVRELVNSSDGAGLHFDGAAGNIDIASPPDLGTKFSFEFIIQADSYSLTDTIRIIDFGTGGRFLFGWWTGLSNNLSIYSVSTWTSLGVKVLDDLKVHHLVLTVDNTAVTLYDNGNQVSTATIALPDIDNCTDARIGSEYNNATNPFNGTLYRTRFWNKTLSSAEVQTAYERADVDFADQYGSQTEKITAWTNNSSYPYETFTSSGTTISSAINSSGYGIAYSAITLEAGKKYRITYDITLNSGTRPKIRVGSASTSLGTSGVVLDTDATGSHEFTATSSSTNYAGFWTDDGDANNWSVANFSFVQIGCASDYDLAFASPSQSLTVQDRAAAADGTCSASGVTQVQPVVQLNSTSARIGTTAATPADGDIVVSGDVGVGKVPSTNQAIAYGPSVQVGQAAALIGAKAANNLFLSSNALYNETDWKLTNDGQAGQLFINIDGSFKFRQERSSGSADDNISWDDALIIDSSGNLFLGNTLNNTSKTNKVAFQQYASSAESEGYAALFNYALSGNNNLYIGGGSNSHNAATKIEFYTAADETTRTGTARLSIDSTGLATFSAGITVSGGITTLGSFSELTINSGQITVTQSVHTVDTEGDAATDDLDTINGGSTGSILVLKSVLGSRHVVLKDGTDNLRLNGDCELGTSNDTITLMKVSTVWREMSRSLN
jgi:hypothetical protein